MRTNYKTISACALAAFLSMGNVSAQSGCSLTNTASLHGFGCGYGDEIDYFELDGVAANNSGCAAQGFYEYHTAPVWTLQIGQTYTWTADVGNFNYQQGFAMWIDLNNDGFFTASEQMGNGGNPAFTHSGSFMVPFSATPGAAHRMRLRCDFANNVGNTNQTACEGNGPPNYNFYYGETEDYDVYLLPAPPCSGTPAANSVVGPTAAICPGALADLWLNTTYTVGGLTFQWQTSTLSAVGPWTNVGSSSMMHTSSPLNVNTWFQTVVTCTNSSASITASAALVQVQGVVIDSIPYLEDFEGINGNDVLPNCSWSATNLGSEAMTYTINGTDNRIPHSGNNFASFYYWPGGTNAFYTNGIYLNAGVTYSASVYYITNQWGDNNWEDLSILIGPNQSSVGQITVASTPGPAISSTYKLLSNTFTVATSGVYYASVRTTVNTNQYAPYLTWDDLSITAPCNLNPVNMQVSATTNTICEGDPVTLNASGVNTYSWYNGASSSAITIYPTESDYLEVTGTSTLTGCSVKSGQYITVNPTPFVAVVADKQRVCAGGQVNLTAVGNAASYIWSNNAQGSYITFAPQNSGPVTVLGTNLANCTASAMVNLTVNPLPNVTASASRTMGCVGEEIVLTGTGAQSYQWLTSSTYIQTNPAVVVPAGSVTYSLVGTDANGCQNTAEVSISLDICESISEGSRINGLKLYPNPGTGVYSLETERGTALSVKVTDLVGREVYKAEGDVRSVDISTLSNGIYYFNITSGEKTEVIRVIKN